MESMKQRELFEKTSESNRIWEERLAEEQRISRQRLENLLSQGYSFGEPHPEGNVATPQPLMGPSWVPGQMRGPSGTPIMTPHYVNGMVIYQQPPFGAPIQGQFGPNAGPFYPGPQPFMVPFGFQPGWGYPSFPSYPGPNLNPNSGSTYNPGTFGANSGQSLGSSTHSSPDLSRRSITTTTTTTTTTTSTGYKATIVTPTRRF